jgi:hypothetical protein
MRAIMTVMVVATLVAVAANAQPVEAPPPPPPPPPLANEIAPAEPAPSDPDAPAPVRRSPQDELVERAILYYEQTREAPPEVAAYLARNPALGTLLYVITRAQSAIIWLFLFLLIGLGGRELLRRVHRRACCGY